MRHLAFVLLLICCCASAALAQDTNVALASNGATIRADSEYLGSPVDTGGGAPASRLIDGIIRASTDAAGFNRWHSALSAPNPHWVWVRFARPAHIHKVTLWRADIGAPVDFSGQCTVDQGHGLKTLFSCKGVHLDATHISTTIEFPPIETDCFRLQITRSSNPDFPQYAQLSELQVFGAWVGDAPMPSPQPAPKRIRGAMSDGPMPAGLRVETSSEAITYTSNNMKISFPLDRPGISYLALDSTGSGRLAKNLLKLPQGASISAVGWNDEANSSTASFTVTRSGATVRYLNVRLAGLETDDLIFTVEPRGLTVSIERRIPVGYIAVDTSPLQILFNAAVTPPSPMGRLKSRSELQFPVLLHFPDNGTLLVRANGGDPSWGFVGRRDTREVQLSLHTGMQATTGGILGVSLQSAGDVRSTLSLKMLIMIHYLGIFSLSNPNYRLEVSSNDVMVSSRGLRCEDC